MGKRKSEQAPMWIPTTDILKRLLVHAGAFNLGLLMRKAFGRGTPRSRCDWGGRLAAAWLER